MLTAISLSGRLRRPLLALIAAAIVGAAVLLGYLLWSSHRDALAEAERTTRNFAWLLEASFDAALRRADAHLNDIGDTIPSAALAKAAVSRYAADLDRELDRHMRNFPELDAVRVFDAAGDMLYTSASATTKRTNIADRPYFRRLRDDPHAGLVFSEVLVARASGRPAIIAARALYRDGRFAGVTIALLDLEHFQHLFDSIDIGHHGLIAVRRSDDFTLALRRPSMEREVNQALPPQNPLVRAVSEGQRMATMRFSAKTDGIERIFSIRTLERYPYYVIVGLASDEVLAGWRIRALATGSFGALLLGLLGVVLVRLVMAEAQAARIVGELAQSSRQLVESEARLDDALEIARMAEWEYDVDSGRFLLNDRFFRVLGTDVGCAGGYSIAAADFAARLVHPDDVPLLDAMLQCAATEVDPCTVREEQLRLRCGGMAARWMLLRFKRVPSREGGTRLLAGTLLDVHERQQAEQARRRLAGLQTAILEAAGYSIISTTPDGVITSFNQAAERMLGYSAAEMIDRQTPAVIHDAGEVALRATEFSAELGVVIEPGFEVFVARSRRQLPNTYEWTYVRKDGSRFPVLLSVTALRDEDGVISGFLGIAADITERKVTLEALRESEAALNAAQAVAHVGSWTLDLAANRLIWSDETYRIFGIAVGTPLSYDVFLGQVHPADRDAVDAAWNAALGGAPYDFEHRLLVAGEVRWVRERAQLVFDAAGRPLSGVGTVQDVTERKQAEQRLQLLAGAFQHSGEALMITDHDNRIIEINPAFTQQTGYAADEVRGRNPSMLSAGRTPAATYRGMWEAIRRNGYWQGEIWDRRKDGGIFPKLLTITVVRDAAGAILHHIASFTDITQQKATEEQIRHLALHDALTGLPNRLDLTGRLEQALAAARRDGQQVAVMFIDLDHFKQINDSLGHKVGDLLLVEVARRLKACVRDSDIVARLGGDEFVVVLPSVTGQAMAGRMADKILMTLDQPYLLEDKPVESSPSIGIALFPDHGADEETLLKAADQAMYRAKALGRNNWQLFAG